MQRRDRARTALERDLERHRTTPTTPPASGWVRAIRDALGMSARELGDRVGLSQQRVVQIEAAERDRSLTLATLERVAAGLECRVEYVLVPIKPLDALVADRARAKAQVEVAGVQHTMALEDQRVEGTAADAVVDAAALGWIDRRGLWS